MAVSDLSQRWTFAAAVLLGVLNLPTQSAAIDAPANYPSQSIRMIVPFAPAGASDFVARIIQNSMAQFLGGSIVIDNRAGAAGNIGMAEAARAPADGYTLFLGNVGTLAVNPSLFPHLHHKSDRDFVAISLVAETPDVHPNTSFPPNNVRNWSVRKVPSGAVNFAARRQQSQSPPVEVFRRDAG